MSDKIDLDKLLIKESQYILDLKDDWDGEGSIGYSQETWSRAIEFVIRLLSYATKTMGRASIPEILPGPDGSIDIHWKTESHELLINIRADSAQLAGYYGDDNIGQTIKGKINVNVRNVWLMTWLYGRFVNSHCTS